MIDLDLIQHAEALRALYPSDNRIGLLLDELLKDLRDGAKRKELLADAKAAMDELGPTATAYGVLQQMCGAIKAIKPKRKRSVA